MSIGSIVPAAMIPRAVNEIDVSIRRLAANRAVCVQCPVAVICVKGTSDNQDRRQVSFKILPRASFLPEAVIVRMFHHLMPKGKGIRKGLCHSGHRAGFKEERIDVAFHPGGGAGGFRGGIVMLPVHRAAERISVQQHKHAVVVRIIPHIPVIYRGLR